MYAMIILKRNVVVMLARNKAKNKKLVAEMQLSSLKFLNLVVDCFELIAIASF